LREAERDGEVDDVERNGEVDDVERNGEVDAGRNGEMGETIAFVRRLRGLSQTECAEKAGLDKGVLSKVENGRRAATASLLCKLADALGVDPVELLVTAGYLSERHRKRRGTGGPVALYTDLRAIGYTKEQAKETARWLVAMSPNPKKASFRGAHEPVAAWPKAA